jgi:subtilisin-like proprotein convertase family protein
MNTKLSKSLGALGLLLSLTAQATIYTYDSGILNATIRDGDVNGWQDSHTFSGIPDLPIQNVEVTLNISGGFNGDLYGYLVHDSGFVVLLNRVGVGTTHGGDAFGYGNAGMNITLATGGSLGDIHWYGGSGIPDGTYAPDGRTVSPLSAPSAFNADGNTGFGSFTGGNPNGTWTLFLSDVVASGNPSTLVSWGLEIEAVPEPTTWALIIFAGLAGAVKLGGWVQRRRRSAAGSLIP